MVGEIANMRYPLLTERLLLPESLLSFLIQVLVVMSVFASPCRLLYVLPPIPLGLFAIC